VKWFGENWNALVCYETEHAETPVGRKCGYCQEQIKKNSQGVLLPHWADGSGPDDIPYELSCFLKMLGLEKDGVPRR
jgi:hypothetical protein